MDSNYILFNHRFSLSLFFICFILFYFLDTHISLLFLIGVFFFYGFFYIKLFVFCTTLIHLEIKKIYINRTRHAK